MGWVCGNLLSIGGVRPPSQRSACDFRSCSHQSVGDLQVARVEFWCVLESRHQNRTLDREGAYTTASHIELSTDSRATASIKLHKTLDQNPADRGMK